MSKVIAATCDASTKVTAESTEVVGAIVLSQGKRASSGVAVMDGDKVWYLTSNATDIVEVIEKVTEMINDIATILTSIGAGMTGPTTAPPGTLATDVAELTSKASALESIKETLK